jgi:hypothetical protein
MGTQCVILGVQKADSSPQCGPSTCILVDVITTCADNRKPRDREADEWAASYCPSIENLVTQVRISRAAPPLVTVG